MKKILRLFTFDIDYKYLNWGLLITRVAFGGLMLISHGWGKLMAFGEKAATFSDPLGLGSTLSLGLAVFAEVFCALAVILGLFTRLSAIPLVFTMLTAAFIVHMDDPWKKQEFAILYLIPFLALVFTGPGRYSLDFLISERLKD